MPVCVNKGLPKVGIEADGVLSRLLLTFPAHEVALNPCHNSLALRVADLGYSLGVHMEATIAQPNLVGMGHNPASVHRYHAVAVLVDVTVNPNELADGEFWFKGLSHGFDSSNFSGWLNN